MNEDDEIQDSPNLDETDVDLEDNATDDLNFDEPQQELPEDRITKLEEQNRRLYARLKKTEEKKEAPKEQPEPKKDKVSKSDEAESLREELTRVRLESKGFNDDEQEIILKASKALGITPIEAAKDDIVIGKINAMREEIKTNNAIPRPSGKAGETDANSIEYYLRTGEIPEDDALADKVDEERIRRSKEQI